MSKSIHLTAASFKQHLVSFALHTANVIDAKLHGREAKAAMLRHAATMTDEAKADADLAAVHAIGQRFGVKAQTAVKQAKYSGLNFEHGSAAHQALARARRLLAPTSTEQAEEMVAALVPGHANKADPVAAMVKRYEGLTPGQKRSFLAQLGKR